MQNFHTSNAASAASISATEKTADELISTLDRVGQHLAAGAVAARSPAATDREPTTDELAAPGLLATIRAYLDAMAEFNTNTLTDNDEIARLAERTYDPHYQTICDWKGAATSREEAVEALRLADTECRNGDQQIAAPMVRAALTFFEAHHLKEVAEQAAAKNRFWTAITTNYSLTDAMAAYELGRDEFVAGVPKDGEPEEGLDHRTYGQPMEALRAWDRPARSAQEATAAFAIGVREIEQGDDETGLPLINAALGFMRSLGVTGLAARDREPVTNTEEVGRAFDAIREMQSIVRLARLAIDERVSFFEDFDTIDTKEPVGFVEDLNCALGLVDRQASEAIEIVNDVLYRTYGAK